MHTIQYNTRTIRKNLQHFFRRARVVHTLIKFWTFVTQSIKGSEKGNNFRKGDSKPHGDPLNGVIPNCRVLLTIMSWHIKTNNSQFEFIFAPAHGTHLYSMPKCIMHNKPEAYFYSIVSSRGLLLSTKNLFRG